MSKSNVNISVIVPLYNTECYIEECIKSVLIQDIDFELIVIDDGSTDNSYNIVNDFSRKDSRVILIKQRNQGVFKARNLGLEIATGDYIAFLDCDDWILPGSLKALYWEAQNNNADLVMGNTLFFYSPAKIVQRYILPNHFFDYTFDGELLFCKLMDTSSYIPMVYNYIYKRSFLEENNFRFKDVNHEDEIWTLQAMCKAGICRVIDLQFYYYRQRAGSIMNGGLDNNNRTESLKIIAQYLYQFASTKELKGNTRLWILVKCIQMIYYRAFSKPIDSNDTILLEALNNMFKSINKDNCIQKWYLEYYNNKLKPKH